MCALYDQAFAEEDFGVAVELFREALMLDQANDELKDSLDFAQSMMDGERYSTSEDGETFALVAEPMATTDDEQLPEWLAARGLDSSLVGPLRRQLIERPAELLFLTASGEAMRPDPLRIRTAQ